MKKIEAVIFDWAGTTVDYGSFAPVVAFAKAFEKFGIKPTTDEIREPMGMLKWDHIHAMMKMPRITEEWKKTHGRMWEKSDVDAIYEQSERAIFEVLNEFSTPKPYVTEEIAKLREKGIKIGSTTGYTTEMMEIVVKSAEKQGYKPDAWFCPNHTNNIGRPYPYMIFRNLEALGVGSVGNTIKVGDTVADIKEGKNAGMIAVGVVEGSSVMGYSEDEYEAFSPEKKKQETLRVRNIYLDNGADYVIKNMSELCSLIEKIEE